MSNISLYECELAPATRELKLKQVRSPAEVIDRSLALDPSAAAGDNDPHDHRPPP
jgi:hypothetical protein